MRSQDPSEGKDPSEEGHHGEEALLKAGAWVPKCSRNAGIGGSPRLRGTPAKPTVPCSDSLEVSVRTISSSSETRSEL